MSQKTIDFGWSKVVMTGDPQDAYFTNLENYLNGSPSLWHYVGKHLPPDAVIIDCGANIGATALMMATRCTLGHVYAFEASPKNAALLRRNVELTAIKNVTVIETALGDVEADVQFRETAFGAGSHIIPPDGNDRGQLSISLRSVPLDRYASKLMRLDFIKMDVEGYEPAVMLGAQALIKSFRPAIYLEINAYSLSLVQRLDPLDFVKFLWAEFEPFCVEHGGVLTAASDAFSFLRNTMVHKQCVDDVLLIPRSNMSFPCLAEIVARSDYGGRLDRANARIKELEAALADRSSRLKHVTN
jgi:FkbM family methyltransferase